MYELECMLDKITLLFLISIIMQSLLVIWMIVFIFKGEGPMVKKIKQHFHENKKEYLIGAVSFILLMIMICLSLFLDG